jgi:hypothetical protein
LKAPRDSLREAFGSADERINMPGRAQTGVCFYFPSALMSTQPAPSEDGGDPSFSNIGVGESVCMHCFETLRAGNAQALAAMERAHLPDCPQRPWR